MIIYNANGEPKTVEPVDAREHVASGRWFHDPPAKKDKPKPEEDKPKPEKSK